MKTQLLSQRLEHIGADGLKRRFDISELVLQPTPISINCFDCGEVYRSATPVLIRHWMSAHKCNRFHSIKKDAAPPAYGEVAAKFRAAPCPICKDGESRLFIQEGFPIRYDEGDRKERDDDFTNYVECICGFQGPSATNDEAAIVAWNNNLARLAPREQLQTEAA